MAEPIPAEAPYGVANWVDNVNNWREVDAEWTQARAILRFASNSTRNSALPSPGVGQFVYNNTTDALQFWSKTGAWKDYKPLPAFTTSYEDTGSGVTIGHINSGGKGVRFTP